MEIRIICQQNCKKCQSLVNNVVVAAEVVGFAYNLERIFDPEKMVGFDPVCCPGLFINGELRSLGRILSAKELERLFTFLLKSSQ